MSDTLYKALGFLVWRSAWLYLRRRYGLRPRHVGAGAVAAAAALAAAVAIAQRRAGGCGCGCDGD